MHAETNPEVETEVEAVEETAAEVEAPAEATAEPEGELVVTIGDEHPEADPFVGQKAPSWVKDLRKKEREQAREIAKLKEQLQAATPAAQLELPKEPELEDYDYDSARFKAAHRDWLEKSRAIEAKNKAAKDHEAETQRAWQERLAGYDTNKKKLGVADYDEAEQTVFGVMSATQQGIILQGSDKPELIIYALGRNPAKLQSLASIQDPVRYAFAVAQLETQLKTTRRPATQPEGRVEQRSAGVPTTSQAGLEKLRAEAAKTGNYSKVLEYKRQMREAKK